MKKYFLFLSAPLLLWPQLALAHCPLCTIGAGGAALLATWLGVSTLAVGIFIGAFALAIGLWMLKLLRKKFHRIPKVLQAVFVLAIFFLTILPILPLMPGYSTFSIFKYGDYGTLLNRTYLVNSFLIGSFIGASLLFISPTVSKALSRRRKGKLIPFQGMLIHFGLLLIAALLIELV